jgi:DNA-directed RNA polymerase subunit RPC12/RpoP
MKASKIRFVIGLSIFLVLAWCFYTLTTTEEKTLVHDDTRCPDCGRELPRQAQASGECPYCLLDKGADQAPKKKGKKWDPGRLLDLNSYQTRKGLTALGITLSLIIFMSSILLFNKYVRLAPREANSYHHFRCPYCKRKLRYRSNQIGHGAICPGCQFRLKFPSATKTSRASSA